MHNLFCIQPDLTYPSIEDWTLCHWGRTSAVQCCHNQPLIDKVIPMYFKPSKGGDGKPVMSQILISDNATTRRNRPLLHHIQRGHQNIAPGYRGPYIVILVDLGVEESELSAEMDFAQDGNQSLRIYASGLDAETYPFLRGRDHLSRILQDFYRRQFPTSDNPLAQLQVLEDQVQFGLSSQPRHMNVKHQVDS